MVGIPQYKLPLYSTSASAAEAVGKKMKEYLGGYFKAIHILRNSRDRKREKNSPVIVETDRGQIELSSEDERGIGISFDSIDMTGKDGRGEDISVLGYEWGPLDICELHDVASDQPLLAIRLVGEHLLSLA